MPNVAILPPASINVKVGSTNPPTTTSISYGGGTPTNTTALPALALNVRVGSVNPPTATSISYGGNRDEVLVTTLKALTDVNMFGAQDRDVVTYVSASDSFIIAPAENSRLVIDNGFF
jgi:hypothetical protein